MHLNVLEADEGERVPRTILKGPKKELTVWLVDDRSDIRQLYALLLEKQGGFRCSQQFGDPDSLLSFLSRHPVPDIILLDINMGPHNGLDAVRVIKFVSPSTRVFMLTTCADPEHRDRALRDGASGFLLKSTPIEEISAALRGPDAPFPGVARLERASFADQRTSDAKLRETLAQPELGWWQRSARFFSDKLGLTL